MKIVIEKDVADIVRDCINYEIKRMKQNDTYLEQTIADNIIFFVRILRAIEDDGTFKIDFSYELERVMREGGYNNDIEDEFSGIHAAICECECVEKFRDGLWNRK